MPTKSTGPLAPTQSPLEAVHDEVASAIANATPSGAFETGFCRLQALASEHPAFELSIITALKNLKEELMTFASAPNGGPRIAARLRQLENELHGRLSRPNVYTPTLPPKEPVFPAPVAPKHLAGIGDPRSYPWLDSTGSPRAPKQG
jgi:hypothetical protein